MTATIEMPAFTDRKAAQCPKCGTWCEAHPQFKQATRQEPMKFLGWGAYCKGACFHPIGGGEYFTPTALQEAMPV